MFSTNKMPKKKSSSKRDDRDVESEAAEMREMAESELDAVSYNDSGHASDGHSHQTRDDDSDAGKWIDFFWFNQ